MTAVDDDVAAAQIAEDRMASEDSEAKAKELEAEARRLAGLPLSQRAIERKAVAKRFDVTVGVLEVLVKGFIPAQDDGSGDGGPYVLCFRGHALAGVPGCQSICVRRG